ncbi:MAG: aminopeptidase [Bacteriovoracaceae bacterium]|nr:aminopeptidase [Bacteriovoracaceae bacterium]
MDEKILRKYAELVINTGVNLQEGQCLSIKGEPIHWHFIDLLQEIAYKRGAKFVKSDIQSSCSRINKIKYQKDEYLGHVPPYVENEIDYTVKEKWAFIYLEGLEQPDCYESLDPQRNATVEKAWREKSKNLMSAAMNGVCHWTIAPIPTPGWGQKIFGGTPDEKNTKRLWDTLVPILRLNHEDPEKAWREHDRNLKKRIDVLEKMQLDHLKFTGPDTELFVYLTPLSRWCGGSFTSSEGHSFIPNIPTEEIFTTPDFRKTSGKVKVTKPVMVMGKHVEDAFFEFKDGKVVNFTAGKNLEILEKYFEIDPQAKYVGEIALVDMNSPISKTNKIFHSILLDENASCHLALGRGISSAVKGGDKMNEDELKKTGHNISLLHTDFMIGSPEINITGVKRDGQEVNIMENGYFKI